MVRALWRWLLSCFSWGWLDMSTCCLFPLVSIHFVLCRCIMNIAVRLARFLLPLSTVLFFTLSLSLCCACACFPCWASFRPIMGEWRRYGRHSIVDVGWMPSIDAIWSSGHLIIPRLLVGYCFISTRFLRWVESHLRSQTRLRWYYSYVSSTRRLRSEWDPFEILRSTKFGRNRER
jgi:hypothetical protein